MASTPSEQIAAFKNKYGARIKIALNEATREAGESTLVYVKERTKDGEGTSGKLKPLKKSYVEFRTRWKSFLSDDTSPSKSNLTATGQMLDALFLRVVGSRFFIKVNSKKRDQGLGGGGEDLTNDEVRRYTEKAGREFLKLSPDETKDLTKSVRNILSEKLKDLLK